MYEYDSIKDFLKSFFKSRLLVLSLVIILMGGVLLHRLFTLQIVDGQSYQDNYTLRIRKERVLNGTRGEILDCNGNVLAYNELTYKVTLEDNGTYAKSSERNEALNSIIARVLEVLEENGDSFVNDFNIRLKKNGSYAFTVEGTRLMRFRADIYGKKKIDDLGWDKNLKYNTAEATEEQIIQYLCGEKKYELEDTDYSPEMKYKIMVIRYALAQNAYQKYISTTIATGVSDKTMAYIKENKADLQGVDIEKDYIRKYNDSVYFASMIGYTGKISTEEYEELSAKNDSYALTDVIGKSGIEQVMDEQLQGTKGSETVFVDVMGKELETTDHKEPSAGNNIYLSIDSDLQKAVYHLLEQELAGILFNKIINVKEFVNTTGKASDIKIPIYDVYFTLINNAIIDTSHFTGKKASAAERNVQAIYDSHFDTVIARIKEQCASAAPEAYQAAPEEYQTYYSYIIAMLQERSVLLNDKIDKTDETYLAWTKDETISLKEYLEHCIHEGWIDYNIFQTEEEYSDSSEIYRDLIDYITKQLKEDDGFQKKIYQYLIKQDMVSGTQLCLILYDQKVIKKDEEKRAQLENGAISAFTFLKEKVQNMEITPAQLALDPCTASCVITDVKTGQLKALVSYPGYDNNLLANTVDAEYFAKLQSDLSRPMYNRATQERTAPGSTFKMVTAAAGLTEGVITTTTKINNQGKFELVDNEPRCWIYPSRHGWMDVTNAIRVSCNYFFYQVGYDLSLVGNTYSDPTGIRKITDYATEFGFGETTGIEIPENEPEIATQFPVMAAIGQSNHNYATVQLARYVTAVANKGTVYNYTLLKKMTDHNGKTIKTYEPTIKNKMDNIDESTWKAIQNGNRLVVANAKEFRDFPIVVAGKTGTAQQVPTRGNHALFVGYAPFKDPEISIATRIAYGYTSHNAADVSAQILKYCFSLEDKDKLITGKARNVDDSENGVTD
ncbi:MAG: peptidoglycan glycosyltransferase [Eubacterium sp.]|nr:peptidoglycan glycosyltransferase [Eubacterium sp.]